MGVNLATATAQVDLHLSSKEISPTYSLGSLGCSITCSPYADFAEGTTGVRVLQSIDIAVRHAESFAAMQDAIA